MKKVRGTLVALTLSLALAFAWSDGVWCHRQRHKRTHANVHFNELRTGANEPNSISQTFQADDEYGHGWHHPATQLTINCDPNSRIVSFGLNKEGVSGGFGDRLFGMVTAYYLAIMTNASFEVHWTQPYNLDDFFSVPRCDERVGSAQKDAVDRFRHDSDHGVQQGIVRSSIDVWTYFTDSLFLDDVGQNLEVNTNSFHWKDVVRNPSFKDRAASLGLSNLSQAELFKLAINRLLGNPTKTVRDSHETVLRRLAGGYEPNEFGPSYVGVQIRLGGGAVSGWQDPSRHSMEDLQCFAEEAVRLCRLMHIRSIFVTADSGEAVRAFEEGVLREFTAVDTSSSSPPIVVQVPGVIAHTDRSSVTKDQANDIWLKSILDWWVLKHASALVVSRSGFGETAAMASDAGIALRLRLSAASSASLRAEGGNENCFFEELLIRDKDVIRTS